MKMMKSGGGKDGNEWAVWNFTSADESLSLKLNENEIMLHLMYTFILP